MFSGGLNWGGGRTLYVQSDKESVLRCRGLVTLAATIWTAIMGAEVLAGWPSVEARPSAYRECAYYMATPFQPSLPSSKTS